MSELFELPESVDPLDVARRRYELACLAVEDGDGTVQELEAARQALAKAELERLKP